MTRRNISSNETCVAHIAPETKQQSMHWLHSGSPYNTKFKQTLSARKMMYTVFYNRLGIFLYDQSTI